jgi:hypothetical protein
MSLFRISGLIRLVTTFVIAAVTLPAGSACARSAADLVPIRRPARIEVTRGNNVIGDNSTLEVLAQLFPGVEPDDFTFLAGDFLVPKATTAELATFTRDKGPAIGIQWFCDAYAPATDGEPSLRGLLDVLASEGGDDGELAGDALVCPLPGGPRRRPARTQCPDTIAGVACRVARRIASAAHAVAWIGELADFAVGIEGETLTGARCVAPADPRVFDAAACKALFAPWRRTRAFARTLQSAARDAGCLRLRAGAHPSLPPGVVN